MPTVSQVSTIDTPLAFIGTPNCSTVGPSFGSCSIAPVMNSCADGAPLANYLRAWIL